MDSRSHLFAELETLQQNTNHLKQLHATKVKGTQSSTVSICFSSNLNAEGVTNPHCRNPPLRKDRLHKIGQAIMKARSHLFKDDGDDDSGELGPGDLFYCIRWVQGWQPHQVGELDQRAENHTDNFIVLRVRLGQGAEIQGKRNHWVDVHD